MNNKIYSILFMLLSSIAVNAQTLTLDSEKNDISAAESGNYDRVEYVRQVEEGTTVLVSFPAKLDGYYFGPEAERLIVTSVQEGTDGKLNISTETMADTLDFVPGKKYLISPTQSLETIVCLSPAKKTVASQTTDPLVCKVVNNGATAIADITVLSNCTDAHVYDTAGKRVPNTGKAGIYIIKNRKILIR